MSFVSVIIPNYNRSGLVNETVRNVLAQSLPPHEVIVVDDGSTDDSVTSLTNEFGNQITVVAQKNAGPGAARNRGIEIAGGKYIWFMDSDDLASLNKLETQVEVLENSNADIAYGPWLKACFSNGRILSNNIVLQQRPLPSERSALTWFVNNWSNVFQQLVVRRESIGKLRFVEGLYCGEDGELFVRMLLEGCQIIFDRRSLLLYRLESPNQLTSTGSSCRRHSNWAAALVRIANELLLHENFSEVAQSGFRARLMAAQHDLKNCDNDHAVLLNQLNELIVRCRKPLFPDKVHRELQRISGGMRNRLLGHRWHRCFMASRIEPRQIELLKQMGYSIQS